MQINGTMRYILLPTRMPLSKKKKKTWEKKYNTDFLQQHGKMRNRKH